MALSKIDTTNMIEDVPQSKLDNNINFRNIIINGRMDLAQRGTSQSSVGSTSGYFTVDRFQYAKGGTVNGVFTMSQDTDVPSGQGFAKSLKMDVTTADASIGADAQYNIRQRIEGQNLQYLKKGTSSAQSTTISFWVKSNKTGTYIVSLVDIDNSRTISKSYTINSASTWEKKTITYDGDTTGTLDNDNAVSLDVMFRLGAGSNFTSGTLATSWESTTNANVAVGQVNVTDSTSNEWYITGVQLEAGTTASDFEFLPRDINLARCQRYLCSFDAGPLVGICNSVVQDNADSCHHAVIFPVEMRTGPSTTVSNLIVTDRFTADNPVTGIYTTISNTTSAYFVTQQSGGLSGAYSDRDNLILAVQNGQTGFLRFTSEL